MKRAEGVGAWGERKAARYLRKKGYKIVEMNHSCRFGEIDIIAKDDAYLLFVEVKLRKDESHGEAREFVTPQKQGRLLRTAELYLSQNSTELQPRFDVVEIYAPEGVKSKNITLTHLEDAFS